MNRWLQWVLAVLAFALGAALVVWLNLHVLCLGDLKFDQGCGGFGVYYGVTFLLFTPLAMVAAGLTLPRRSAAGIRWLVAAYVFVLGAIQVGFLDLPPELELVLVAAAYLVVLVVLLGLRVRDRPGAAA